MKKSIEFYGVLENFIGFQELLEDFKTFLKFLKVKGIERFEECWLLNKNRNI